MPKKSLAFVYGTLRKGGHYHRAIEGAPFVGKATTTGKLYNMGRFPAAVFGEPGIIHGEVYEVSASMIDVMDGIEGYYENRPEASFYVRRKIPVTMQGGETTEAWAYECDKVDGKPEIPSGDYTQYLKPKGVK